MADKLDELVKLVGKNITTELYIETICDGCGMKNKCTIIDPLIGDGGCATIKVRVGELEQEFIKLEATK